MTRHCDACSAAESPENPLVRRNVRGVCEDAVVCESGCHEQRESIAAELLEVMARNGAKKEQPMPDNIESWRRAWRDGFAWQFTNDALLALRHGLRVNDSRLIQKATTQPPPMQAVADWPVEAACGLCFGPWIGDDIQLVGKVEEKFAEMCWEADRRLGEPRACAEFLNWFDQTARHIMRPALLAEVDHELRRRADESARRSFVCTECQQVSTGWQCEHCGYPIFADENEIQPSLVFAA